MYLRCNHGHGKCSESSPSACLGPWTGCLHPDSSPRSTGTPAQRYIEPRYSCTEVYRAQDLLHRGMSSTGTWLQTIGLKGRCQEIFCFWFFYESVSPQPQSIPFGPFRFFLKIRKSRCITGISNTGGKMPLVSTTLAANLPPVSMTLAANFATRFPSVVDTGHRCQRYQRQIIGTILGCWDLKVNLKTKMYL